MCMRVCVRIAGESMAILTKPCVKIRAWLFPCVSLLNRLIAFLYGLLIAWAHVSPSGLLEFCEYGAFFAFTHCFCSSVCPGFLYMYISLSLYAACMCYCLYCVSCWLTANLAGAQPSKLTNLFPDDLLLTPSCPALWLAAHTPSAPLALMPPPPSNSVSRLQMQLHLNGLQQNATDLRKQLSQLRKTQVYRIFFKYIFLFLPNESVLLTNIKQI